MMKVVGVMGAHAASDGNREPTWDEAVAQFGTGESVDLARPGQKIVIEYRREAGRIRASSPDLTGFEVIGPSLDETKSLVRENLDAYLQADVELDERPPPTTLLKPGRWAKAGQPRGAPVRDALAKALEHVAQGLARGARALQHVARTIQSSSKTLH